MFTGITKMENSERETIKKWIKTWERADKALKVVKQRELRSYDYKKNQYIVDQMLQWACKHGKIRLTSGLVEQQRIFMKSRQKQAE